MRNGSILGHVNQLKSFAKSHAGQKVLVAGMWMGDVVATIVDPGSVWLKVKLDSGVEMELPYCEAMKLAEA